MFSSVLAFCCYWLDSLVLDDQMFILRDIRSDYPQQHWHLHQIRGSSWEVRLRENYLMIYIIWFDLLWFSLWFSFSSGGYYYLIQISLHKTITLQSIHKKKIQRRKFESQVESQINRIGVQGKKSKARNPGRPQKISEIGSSAQSATIPFDVFV